MTDTKTIRQTVFALCVALLLVCGMTRPAFANATSANVNLDAKGSISATLTASDGTHPSDGELSLYQVANLERVNGNMVYTYTAAFEGCEASLDDVTVASLASELDAYVKEHGIAAVSASAIASDGAVSFADLPVGLYLIAQTTQSSGYSLIDSFLVSIPLDENDTWVYDVDASPKIEPATPESPNDNPDNPGDNPPGDDNPDTPGDTTPGGTTPGSSTPGSSGGTTGSGGSGGTTGTGGSGTGSSGSGGSGTGGSGTGTNASNPSTGSTLPQTGQLNWPIPVLVVAGVLCLVVGFIINRSARKKDTSQIGGDSSMPQA